RFEQWLINQGLVSDEGQLQQLQEEVDQSFLPELNRALEAEEPAFNRQKEENRLFAPPSLPQKPAPNGHSSEKRFVDAIQFSLKKAFEEDEECIIMGQDIAEYGGVSKITEGLIVKISKKSIVKSTR